MDPHRKSQLMLTALGGVGTLSIAGIASMLFGGQDPQTTFEGSFREPEIIEAPLAAASPENIWVQQGERQLQEMSATVAEMQRRSLELENRVTATLDAVRGDLFNQRDETDETFGQVVETMAGLQILVEEMRQDLRDRPAPTAVVPLSANPTPTTGQGGAILSPTAFPAPVTGATPQSNAGVPFAPAQSRQNLASATGATAQVPVAAPPSKWMGWGAEADCDAFGCSFQQAAEREDPDKAVLLADGQYIPAGAYAPAVVLSGADAVTGVSSRENPTPVLLRVTGPAVTAGEDGLRGETVEITGCTITGSATGDLSSERVYVRFIRMTCIQDGEVKESQIAGYLSGSGKAGARGPVVSRVGPAVRNAALAGIASGVGEIASLAGQSQLLSGAGAASLGQGVGTSALGGGLTGAADTLTEYYIERAEQYQPVVSLYSGTEVEVVFMEGVDLNEG